MARLTLPPGGAGSGTGEGAACSLVVRMGRLLEGDPAPVGRLGASPTSRTTSRTGSRKDSTTSLKDC